MFFKNKICTFGKRTQNTIRNLISGFFLKLISVLTPFLVRTVIIYQFGMEYVGLNSLFASILQVLSVSELGFSSAILFSLYKPVADSDFEKINDQIRLYRSVYTLIGSVIFILGLIVMPFLNHLISGDYPAGINLYLLYFIYLLNTVCSYEFGGYRAIILTVYQRNDLINYIGILMTILRAGLSVFILVFLNNYYLYTLTLPAFTILSNFFVKYVSKKLVPEIQDNPKFSLRGIGSISKQIAGIAIGRVSLVCRNSFDNIILSMLFGLRITALYSNYYYIFSAITGIGAVFLTSMAASVGNSIALDAKEKISSDHIRFDFYFQFFVSVCAICLYCLYQPFVSIWVGADGLFPKNTMVLFCVYFYINNLSQIRSLYTEASGMWWDFRYLTISEAFLNLILNFMLGKKFGVNGILIATIITAFAFSFIGITAIAYKRLFINSPKMYYANNALYALSTVIGALIAERITASYTGNTILGLLLKGAFIGLFSVFFLMATYLLFPETRKLVLKPFQP